MNQRAVIIAGGVLAALVALALVLPTLDVLETPFSAYGDGDDDVSILVNGLRTQGFEAASLTLGPPALDGVDPGRTDAFYLAVGVDRGYSQPEVDALYRFVERGGTAIVMDDTGASDALLDRLGVQKGARLLSTTGDQPSVVPVEIETNLVNLWEPVELVPSEDANVEVIATAENTTAKDTNQNDQVDPEEPTCAGGCPVALRSDVGEGTIYVIGDPTFATNKYATSAGAIPLVTSLAQEETTGRRALIIADESRHVAGPAEVGLTMFRVITTPLGISWIAYTAAGLVLAATGLAIARRGEIIWPEHDPGLDEPYLPQTDQEGTTP